MAWGSARQERERERERERGGAEVWALQGAERVQRAREEPKLRRCSASEDRGLRNLGERKLRSAYCDESLLEESVSAEDPSLRRKGELVKEIVLPTCLCLFCYGCSLLVVPGSWCVYSSPVRPPAAERTRFLFFSPFCD